MEGEVHHQPQQIQEGMVRSEGDREYTPPVLRYQEVLGCLQQRRQKFIQDDVAGEGRSVQHIHEWTVISRHRGMQHFIVNTVAGNREGFTCW